MTEVFSSTINSDCTGNTAFILVLEDRRVASKQPTRFFNAKENTFFKTGLVAISKPLVADRKLTQCPKKGEDWRCRANPLRSQRAD